MLKYFCEFLTKGINDWLKWLKICGGSYQNKTITFGNQFLYLAIPKQRHSQPLKKRQNLEFLAQETFVLQSAATLSATATQGSLLRRKTGALIGALTKKLFRLFSFG